MSDDKPAPKKPRTRKPKPPAEAPATGAAASPKTKPIPVVRAKPVEPAAAQPAAVEPATAEPAAVEPAETQPTEVIAPAATEPTPASTAPAEPEPEPVIVVVDPPKKKRRRWPWVLGGVLLVLVILGVIAFIVGDNYAKNYARDYIKQRIVAVLGIEDPSQVTVDIGTGSVLLQALSGKLDSVDIDAGTVTFGTLTGDATVHAEGVPLNAEAATEKLEVTFAVPEDQVVNAVGSNLSALPIDSITLEEPEIVVKATIPVFIFEIPVGMGLEPSAEEGQIVLTPAHIQLFEDEYTAEEASEQLGDLAGELLAKQKICVDESLPVALTIVDVDVVEKNLVIEINGDGVALGGPDLSTPGTCAG